MAPNAPTLTNVSAGLALTILGPMSVLDLRLLLRATVTLFFLTTVRARDLVQLLISLVRKASLLSDVAAFAAAICPRLTAHKAIEQIAIGLYLVRGTFEEPSKAHQIERKHRPVGRVVLRQDVTHRQREHGRAQLKLCEFARRGQRLGCVGQMFAGRTPGQDIIDLLEPVYGRLHWSLICI